MVQTQQIIWYKISFFFKFDFFFKLIYMNSYKYKCLVFRYKSLDSTNWQAKGTKTGVIVQNEKNSTKGAN